MSAAGVVLLLVPSVAHANAGLPMLLLVAPFYALTLLPIVLVEGALLGRTLDLGAWEAQVASLLGNLCSTLVGVPLTWGVLFGVQMAISAAGVPYGVDTAVERLGAVTLQAPWLHPHEGELHWILPGASLYLGACFFLVSVWSERIVCVRHLRAREPQRVRRAVLQANAITYGAFGLAGLVWLAWSVRSAA